MDTQNPHIDDLSLAQYTDWIRGQGPKPDERIISHVESCTACKKQIMEMADILDQDDQVQTVQIMRSPIVRNVLRVAAILIGVFIVAMAIQYLKEDKPDIKMVDNDTAVREYQTDSVGAIDPEENLNSGEDQDKLPAIQVQHDTVKYAANFRKNEGLEMMIKANFRSEASARKDENSRSDENYLINDYFVLELGNVTDLKLQFSLMNNQGMALLTMQNVQSDSIELHYEPGVYYWKLTSYDEVLQLGRLFLYSQKD